MKSRVPFFIVIGTSLALSRAAAQVFYKNCELA